MIRSRQGWKIKNGYANKLSRGEFVTEKDGKTCLNAKTIDFDQLAELAEHPFAGQNTQQRGNLSDSTVLNNGGTGDINKILILTVQKIRILLQQ